MKKFLLLIISIFLLTGCYDYKELKDIDVITGVGIDYEDGEYVVTLEILRATASGDKQELKTVLVQSEDEVFSKAFETNYTKISKLTYFSHLQLIVVSEEVAQEKGMQEIIDFLLRTSKIGNTFYTAVANGYSAYEIFDNKQKDEAVATYLVTLLKNSNENSFITVDNQFDLLTSKLLSKGHDIYLPSITIEEEDFKVSGLAIFDGFDMVGYIEDKYSTILSLATMSSMNNIYVNDGINAINIDKSDYKIEVEKDKITIVLSLEGTIKSLDKEFSLKDEDTFTWFEDHFSELIKKELETSIQELRYYNSDILGLGNKYYKKYPRKYHDGIGNEIDYEIKVDLDVNKFGILFEVIQ